MKILVTGAKGFIGKNLIVELRNQGYEEIFEVDQETGLVLLEQYTKNCEFVMHLAGINRPEREEEFILGNVDFTYQLIHLLTKYQNKAPILLSSSIQAEADNAYGRSKKRGEEIVLQYGKKEGVRVFVYRLPNVFGKWCRPHYNSVTATFCHNIARDLPVEIHHPEKVLDLVYIDDVVKTFINTLGYKVFNSQNYYSVVPCYKVTLEELAQLIRSFRKSREDLMIPPMSDKLVKKLYSTYLSYLPQEDFKYPLLVHKDHRGAFAEFIKTPDRGQISVNILKVGMTKGNHWHQTKNEKFLVVKGRGSIRLRKIDSHEIIGYRVSDEVMEVIDIPVGYTHQIVNEGDEDMIVLIWANELFDKQNADTYFLEV